MGALRALRGFSQVADRNSELLTKRARFHRYPIASEGDLLSATIVARHARTRTLPSTARFRTVNSMQRERTSDTLIGT